MIQKSDKPKSPYLHYADIGMICMGAVLLAFNIGLRIAMIVRENQGYGKSGTHSNTFAIFAGIMLIIYGIRGIKKDKPNKDIS